MATRSSYTRCPTLTTTPGGATPSTPTSSTCSAGCGLPTKADSDMRVRRVELYSPVIGAAGSVLCYGEWGRPVLAFPSEQGRAEDFANNGMVATAEGLIAAGRVKIYSVDSYDSVSWAARDVPLEERARRHGAYESGLPTRSRRSPTRIAEVARTPATS